MLKKEIKIQTILNIIKDCKPHCVECISKETGYKTGSGDHLWKQLEDLGYGFKKNESKTRNCFAKQCSCGVKKTTHRQLTSAIPIHEQKGNLHRAIFTPNDKKRIWKLFNKKCPYNNNTIAHYGDIEIDHRSPAKELKEKEISLNKLTDQEIKDRYMPLYKHDNQVKRNKCKTCLETKKRPSGPAGSRFFFEGDDNYTEKTGCNGCYWAFPEKWGEKINELNGILNK
jgi:hypothetical protein